MARNTRSAARGGKAATSKPARRATTRTYTRLEDEYISSDSEPDPDLDLEPEPEPELEGEDEPAPPPKKRARATKAATKATTKKPAAKATKAKPPPPADEDIILSDVEPQLEAAPPPKQQGRPRPRPRPTGRAASPDIVELDGPPPAYSPREPKLKAEVVGKASSPNKKTSRKKVVKSPSIVPSEDEAEVDYRGEDLDKYDDSFIDDRAVESNDDVGDDEVDGQDEDGNESGIALSEDDGPMLSDVEPEPEVDYAEQRLAEIKKSVAEAAAAKLAKEEAASKLARTKAAKGKPVSAAYDSDNNPFSNSWGGPVLSSPSGPTHTRTGINTTSPVTPSPQKNQHGKRPAKNLFDDVSPKTPSKSRRKMPAVQEQPEDDGDEPQTSPVPQNAVPVTPKTQTKKTFTNAGVEPGSLAKSSAKMTPQKLQAAAELKTPVKATTTATTVPMTPLSKRLATLNLAQCEISGAPDALTDNLLRYDTLVPLQKMLAIPVPGRLVQNLSFSSGVVHFYGFDRPDKKAHLAKLIRKVQQPTFADGLVVNAARCDPRSLIAGTDSAGNPYLMRLDSNGKLVPTAFTSFARVRSESKLHEASKMGTTDWATRWISGSLLNIESERAMTINYLAFAKEQLYDVSFDGGLSFSTMLDQFRGSGSKTAMEGFNAAPTASTSKDSKAKGPSEPETFLEVLAKLVKRQGAPTYDFKIPCFDASHIFMGKNVGYSFELTQLDKTCPVYEAELVPNDFVMILHSYFPSYRNNIGNTVGREHTVGRGLYAVILIAHAP